MPVQVSIAVSHKRVPVDRPLMRAAARAVFAGEGVTAAALSLAFVDDPTSARINHQFLGHTGPTDVITFPLADDPVEGELIIGAEVAARVAAEREHAVRAELALYVIHGVLHLCGYNDKTKARARQMRERERHYLAALKLPAIAGG